MLEEEWLEKEVKKKKRRVLAVLFALLMVGAALALPLTGLLPASSTPAPEVAAGTPALTITATRPTSALEATAIGVSTLESEATPAGPSVGTPRRTATALVPKVTLAGAEETPGTPTTPSGAVPPSTTPAVTDTAAAETPTAGSAVLDTPVLTPGSEATATALAGGVPPADATATIAPRTPAVPDEESDQIGTGTPSATSAAAGTPTDTSRAVATPAPTVPEQLPASGADARQGLSWLLWGLAAALFGILMLGAGCALRDAEPGD